MFYEIVMFFSPFHDFSAFLKFMFSSGIPMKFFNKIFRFLLSCAMFYLNFFPWPFHEICNIVTGSGWVNFIEHLFKNKPLFHLFYLFRSVSSQYKHYHQFSIVTLFIKRHERTCIRCVSSWNQVVLNSNFDNDHFYNLDFKKACLLLIVVE